MTCSHPKYEKFHGGKSNTVSICSVSLLKLKVLPITQIPWGEVQETFQSAGFLSSFEAQWEFQETNMILFQSAGSSSSNYAKAQGASDVTMDMFDKMESETPGMNYGMVQSAATSSEFVSRCLVRQKKKFTPTPKK